MTKLWKTTRMIVIPALTALLSAQCGFSMDMLTTVSDAGVVINGGSETTGTASDSIDVEPPGTETTVEIPTGNTDSDIGDTNSGAETDDTEDAVSTDTAPMDTAPTDEQTDIETDTASEVETDTASEVETDTASEVETDTASESTVCPHREILPQEVLLIGDSWISLPGPRVGQLAREAGILALNEDYVTRAYAGAMADDIIAQYDNYVATTGHTIKAVIMNGGAVDIYATAGASATVDQVVATFAQFFARPSSIETFEDVVYVLYSEGTAIPGVPELRDKMGAACANAPVRCHFLDLDPVMRGHSNYVIDTINPTSAGSDAIAGAIWQLMRENCIAQ